MLSISFVAGVLACLASLHLVLAFPSTTTSSPTNTSSSAQVPLRIMALGASVTFGMESSTGNGYRKDLEDLLVVNGSGREVSYVGEKRNGNWPDNSVEATPGFVIAQIAASALASVPKFKPNLVLIDAGTNNCNAGGVIPDAGKNVTEMIEGIYRDSPGATVVLATILVNPDEKMDACRREINSQFTNLTTTLQASGSKLVLVDMRGPNGPLTTDLADGRHPNDGGYEKMANIWLDGVKEASAKGVLTPPMEEGSVTMTSTSMSAMGMMASSTANPVKSEGVERSGRAGGMWRWLGVMAGVQFLLLLR